MNAFVFSGKRTFRKMAVAVLVGVVLLLTMGSKTHAQVDIYTPYTGLSAEPGESITYSISMVNHSSDIQNISVSVEDMPEGWEYRLTSGGHIVHQIAVMPNELLEEVSLQVDVPLEVQQGEYTFAIISEDNGGNETRLPVTIEVTEEGGFATLLETDQPNMQGHAESEFQFMASLTNQTAEEQLYGLVADTPEGWNVNFEVDNQGVTSVSVEAGETQNVTVWVEPPVGVEEGEYPIQIGAGTSATSDSVDLEVVITGTYGLTLTTQNERFSFDTTAGRDHSIDLIVANTGTAELNDITLDAVTPSGWDVQFDSAEIESIPAGERQAVRAVVTSDSNAIAGDYIIGIEASSDEVADSAQFRAEVTTSVLWGWIGVLIIVAVLGGILYLFRKYGRR